MLRSRASPANRAVKQNKSPVIHCELCAFFHLVLPCSPSTGTVIAASVPLPLESSFTVTGTPISVDNRTMCGSVQELLTRRKNFPVRLPVPCQYNEYCTPAVKIAMLRVFESAIESRPVKRSSKACNIEACRNCTCSMLGGIVIVRRQTVLVFAQFHL